MTHRLTVPNVPSETVRSGQGLDLPAASPLRSLDPHSPALVVFLRSFGCTFCREAMADVAAVKSRIQSEGAQIAFVHGGSPDEAAPWFAKYRLGDVTIVSDPARAHYRAFGLERMNVPALIHPQVWTRGAACALAHGFGVQTLEMMRQLPGVFVIQNGAILGEFRHRTAADRPDYLALVMAAGPVGATLGQR